jgi:hypothetical protein
MRTLPACTCLLAALALTGAASASEVSIAQVGTKRVERARNLLATPLPPMINPEFGMPAMLNLQAQPTTNSAHLLQQGFNNRGTINQSGLGNAAFLAQRGSGNIGMIVQTGRTR